MRLLKIHRNGDLDLQEHGRDDDRCCYERNKYHKQKEVKHGITDDPAFP